MPHTLLACITYGTPLINIFHATKKCHFAFHSPLKHLGLEMVIL